MTSNNAFKSIALLIFGLTIASILPAQAKPATGQQPVSQPSTTSKPTPSQQPTPAKPATGQQPASKPPAQPKPATGQQPVSKPPTQPKPTPSQPSAQPKPATGKQPVSKPPTAPKPISSQQPTLPKPVSQQPIPAATSKPELPPAKRYNLKDRTSVVNTTYTPITTVIEVNTGAKSSAEAEIKAGVPLIGAGGKLSKESENSKKQTVSVPACMINSTNYSHLYIVHTKSDGSQYRTPQGVVATEKPSSVVLGGCPSKQ